jgi:hypothetical protein
MRMKKLLMALTLPVTAGIPLYAQDTTPQITQEQATPNANWFSFGPQFGLNLNARFNGIGHQPATSPGSATGGGVNRTYGDGFVHVDSSGNAGGATWNWGYQNASQVSGNTIVMHSVTAPNGSLKAGDDPQDGFDLAYGHDFGPAPGGKWGLQGAFDFTAVSINDNQPVTTHGTVISDAFTFEGVVVPDAPYRGSYNGPGPLLGDSPARTTAAQTVVVTGGRTLDAQVYVLRGGPYYEFKLSERFSGRVGAGLTLAVADMQYSFDETLNFGGGNTVRNSGSGSGAEFGAGGYLEAKLLFAMTDHTSLYFGTQYEYLGNFSHRAANESAQLDMSNTVNILLGVQWNF